MKGSFRKNLQKELKTWIKPFLVVIFIFVSDELSREYISKKMYLKYLGVFIGQQLKQINQAYMG
ncbi:TPA: hypothetical protein NKQ43_002602 [Vibrio parahaemolyticus]|uniref:hypothetical protein n=1 Tax=Vibrio parahaemolyticus TaxID=670 RepID=UPI0007A08F90|nr:hypothetical protein [Vibrio parahaemolyticus]KYY56082.1 hypothetical protein AWQ14_20685 [Vibrio parahaemolyticus]OKY50148.1 hypothetical protein BUL36_12030 [Vibrio parahaemolyticus]HCE2582322.1 hypothetical protein [Vibrio parahaemolyticus]HCE2728006.1 hypothetical protein [Vibrio parahaemolyticus]HCE2810875.1 hypothetical protein [Vibrio parahaemolyticus]